MATVEATEEKVVLSGEIYRSPHVSANDLAGDVTVTIKGYELDKEVGADKARKGILYFEEFPKGMVMNKTNTESVVALHGKVVNQWVGKKITIYPTTTSFGPTKVPCIRVREK